MNVLLSGVVFVFVLFSCIFSVAALAACVFATHLFRCLVLLQTSHQLLCWDRTENRGLATQRKPFGACSDLVQQCIAILG